MKKYSFFSHTADMGIEARGETLARLYEHAAEGLFAYLSVPVDESVTVQEEVAVEGADPESLMVAWLNELLYRSAKNRVLYTAFAVRELSPERLAAKAWGHPLRAGEHVHHEVKAVTYHGLEIAEMKTGGCRVRIIFDI